MVQKPNLEKILGMGFKGVMVTVKKGRLSVYETDTMGVIYDYEHDKIIEWYEKRGINEYQKT